MKILLVGASGRLGRDLEPELAKRHEVIGCSSRDLDITQPELVRSAVANQRPDLVVLSAAWANVDRCQEDPDGAYRVNALGPWNVALACQAIGAGMVFISTDYVFGGEKGSAYSEFDRTGPINTYGATKLAAERFVQHAVPKHYVVRASWFFGSHGDCFAKRVLRAAQSGEEIAVAVDQIGSPSYTVDLSRAISDLIESEQYGLFHLSNRGQCTWHEFAEQILRQARLPGKLKPVQMAELQRPAPRPKCTPLRHYCLELLGRDSVRPWQDALAEFVSKETRG